MAYSIFEGETILTISADLVLLLLLFSSLSAIPPANAQATTTVDRTEDWFMYPSLREILSNQPANITEKEMSLNEWRAFYRTKHEIAIESGKGGSGKQS